MKALSQRENILVLASSVWVGVMGCGGDARVELTTADALTAVAGQMADTIDEYHHDLSQYDNSRESAIISAFVVRVQNDTGNETKIAKHTDDFQSALTKVRTDRETEYLRRTAAMENVRVLREVSQGLQKLAVQSLTLQDEMRRYLTSWIEARQRAASGTQQKPTRTAANPTNAPLTE